MAAQDHRRSFDCVAGVPRITTLNYQLPSEEET